MVTITLIGFVCIKDALHKSLVIFKLAVTCPTLKKRVYHLTTNRNEIEKKNMNFCNEEVVDMTGSSTYEY